MRTLRARSRQSGQDQEFLREDPDFELFSGDHDAPDANSADDVISEMGLALVIMLGVVLAINMVLVAFHFG